MGLTTRFLLLLVGLFVLCLTGVLLMHRADIRELAHLAVKTATDGGENLTRLHALEGEPLLRFASDYSWWDDTVEFVGRPDPAWARINLEEVLEFHELNTILVHDPVGALVYGVTAEGVPVPILAHDALLALAVRQPFTRFHHHDASGLWEMFLAPIQPSSDQERRTPPAGWFIGGRLWDEDRLERFGLVIGGTARLWEAEPPATGTGEDHVVRHVATLSDLSGSPVAWLELTQPSVALAALARPQHREILVFMLYGFVLLGLVVYAVQGWVLRPLRQLGDSLRSRDPADLAPLAHAAPQLRHLADELGEAFAQRTTLEHESEQRRILAQELRSHQIALEEAVAQRSRLSRDLHDHIIQSLYAIGMGLAAIRCLLPKSGEAVEPRIHQLQDTLNDTIRHLRAFITELEPEPITGSTFGSAVHELLDFLRVMRPFEADVALDDALATGLPASTRVHLLHIMRESVSNALRHGEAERIGIDLDRDPGGRPRLVISDNGVGFDPVTARPGRGLVNLRERARLINGTLEVDTHLGEGTRLVVTLSVT